MLYDNMLPANLIIIFRERSLFGGLDISEGCCLDQGFPIRMVGASPKAFSASQEVRKFFHTVCLDLILVETGIFYQ